MWNMVLGGVVLPAAVTALILLPMVCAPRMAAARAVAPLALGAGFAAGFFGCLRKWAAIPPVEHWQWMVWLALLAALAGVVMALPRVPSVVRWMVGIGAAGVFGWLIVPGFADLADVRGRWRITAGVLVLVVGLLLKWSAERAGPRGLTLVQLLGAFGLAGFLVAANTARFGQLAGVYAACLGVFLLAALWRPGLRVLGPAGPVAATISLSLALSAMFYDTSGVPQVAYVLAGAAPALAGIGGFLGAIRIKGWRGALVHAVLVLAPIGVAVALALRAESSTPASDYESYY